LIHQQITVRKSAGWRVYAWVIAMQAVGAPMAAVYFDDFRVMDIVDFVFIVIGVIGLMGYVYALRIGSAGFWRLFLPVFVLWDLFFRFIIMRPDSEIDITSYYLILCILFLFLIPQYIAVYRYQRELQLSQT